MSDFHPYYILAKDNWGDYVGFSREDSPYLKKLEFGGQLSLADIINEWLWYNGGFRRCFNRFNIFLKIIPFMVDDYHRQGSLPMAFFQDSGGNGKDRKFRITSVLGKEGKMHSIFDRDNFQAALVSDE